MPLPPLAFGQADATLTSDWDTASETMAQIVPSMKLAPAAKVKDFRTSVSTCVVGDMRLLAHAATPCRMAVDESRGWHLIAPYVGTASLRCDGKSFDLRSGTRALLMPNMQRSTERAPSSVVIVSLDINRLKKTMEVMSGHAEGMASPAENPVSLHLERNKVLFQTFVHLCRLIDSTRNAHELGTILGLDDLIYRWITFALGDNGGAEINETGRIATAALDAVCDVIISSEDRPLTLSEMEEVSGLSARALQHAFRSRFGCSPMSWQRRERMLLAQRRLINLAPDETITNLAYAMGFSSSAAFATLYKKQFGETPSETVTRFR